MRLILQVKTDGSVVDKKHCRVAQY